MLASRFVLAAALSLALAASSAAQPAAGQVQVQVWSFGFAPHPIHLSAGRPVTMTFVNRSGSSHDFSAHRFFGSSTITAGSAPDGEIDLGPHETRTITLVPRGGVYPVHCSHFFHEQMGMKDNIVVD